MNTTTRPAPRRSRVRRAAGVLTCVTLALGGLVVVGRPASAADASTKYLTIFRETSPSSIPSGTVSRYGVTPASALWFDSWGTGRSFPVSEAKALWSQGVLPHFTWEPWNTSLSVSDAKQIHLQDILNGTWDDYIRARGAEMASAGVPILVRWGHEFDGNWYPWGIANNGNNPLLYAQAFRHVHDVVVAAGATNVQWVWAFNNNASPAASWNSAEQAYPGDAYVDWVGIDGYNWGLAPSWDPSGNYWTSFDGLFSSAYARARSIAPKRPVMIAELGSSEDGGNKAQWIADMSSVLASGRYPDLKSLAWFDQNKEELWAGDSSSASAAAFTSWVQQPYMKGTGADLAQVAAQYKGTTTTTTTPPTTTTTTRPPTTTTTTTTTRPTTTTTGGGKTCSATYTLVGQWPGGFQTDVTVKAGGSAIGSWRLTWTFANGQTVTQAWAGRSSQSGSAVTVTNESWNGALGAGQSTSVGFLASWTGANTTPVVSCTAS